MGDNQGMLRILYKTRRAFLHFTMSRSLVELFDIK